MSSPRERAMDELRAWSTPGTRARLIRQAWDAGEHRVAVLADAASVTRQTAYDDLESQGINPRTDRTEEAPMYQTITVDGMTGTDEENRHGMAAEAAEYQRQTGRDPKDHLSDFAQFLGRRGEAHNVARVHNNLAPAANAAAAARQEAQRAIRVVESRWDALRTARSWLAAHHAYVEAVHVARQRIEAWAEAAHAATRQARHLGYGTPAQLNEMYEPFVPAEQRITLGADDAALALTELEETHRQRREITAETLTHRVADAQEENR